MSLETLLDKRSSCRCELCGSETGLSVFNTTENPANFQNSLMVCQVCKKQFLGESLLDISHWSCLADSMWSEHPAVLVVTYRMLHRLQGEIWAKELFEQLASTLEEDILNWAKEGLDLHNGETVFVKPDFLKK